MKTKLITLPITVNNIVVLLILYNYSYTAYVAKNLSIVTLYIIWISYVLPALNVGISEFAQDTPVIVIAGVSPTVKIKVSSVLCLLVSALDTVTVNVLIAVPLYIVGNIQFIKTVESSVIVDWVGVNSVFNADNWEYSTIYPLKPVPVYPWDCNSKSFSWTCWLAKLACQVKNNNYILDILCQT